MEIETYEQTEVDAELQPECDEEALALIDELELEGQQTLNKRPDGQTVRMPYRKMTANEYFVFDTLFPVQTGVARYNASPIPVRVLQIIAHARDLFTTIQVWDEPDADLRDPVLVGINGPSYERQYFILARWGSALAPMSELVARACEKRKAQVLSKLEEIKSTVEARYAMVEAMPADRLESDANARSIPNYYD